jgi:hypothetical protein
MKQKRIQFFGKNGADMGMFPFDEWFEIPIGAVYYVIFEFMI